MHYVGEWTVALCYFRENVLLASDAPPADWARVVELVESVLERALGLPVVCACISPETPLPASGRCASSTFQIFLGLPYYPPPPSTSCKNFTTAPRSSVLRDLRR